MSATADTDTVPAATSADPADLRTALLAVANDDATDARVRAWLRALVGISDQVMSGTSSRAPDATLINPTI